MAKLIKIYSENNVFQLADTLKRNRKKRASEGLFFVEGVQALNFAAQYGWQIDSLLFSSERGLSGWARGMLKNTPASQHVDMPAALLEKLSDKEEETSELLALVAMRPNDLSRIPVGPDLLALVFDRPSSHGNLGAILRSCESLKTNGLVITGHAVDLYDPKVIRASMGTFFAVPALRLESQKELEQWFAALSARLPGFQLLGSSAKGERLIDQADLKRPTVLLLGNETWGLSAAYKELCHELVRIPMYGTITSLNVSCAASIMLYEADRQRRMQNP